MKLSRPLFIVLVLTISSAHCSPDEADLEDKPKVVAQVPPENNGEGYLSRAINYFYQLVEALQKENEQEDPYMYDIYAAMLTGI